MSGRAPTVATALEQAQPPAAASCTLLAEAPQSPLPRPYHHWTLGADTVWATFHRAGAGHVVRFPGLADFEIAPDARTALCRPCPGVSEATREHLFLNQVRPLMLGRQGVPVFHASAVAAGPGAIAFVAASGLGKSTLAAAFAVAGAGYLSDDGLAIERRDGLHLALPGHPSIRLWDDSRGAILGSGTVTAPPVAYSSKARILSAAGLARATEPRPLLAAFFLGRDSAGRVAVPPLSGAGAVAAWVAHGFVLDPQDGAALDRQFREVTDLVARVPCFRLDYPRRYEALDRVRAAVLDVARTAEREA